ncbi:ATP synthase subunit I [Paenibacillus lutrae]|uniref:ATP synthase subunit I n=1 Tax=Paenibacillus lutrae TaxID=2078573 RepID=A0A7X3K0Q7_9BACL|nr:ATP synthase subunit I [Paenibacillus lutrae]MVP01494.1 ATP synthase subunit I [Paenibacillus lutrae]
MNDLLRTALRITLFVLAASVLIWAAYPPLRTITAGLTMGAVASGINALLLQRRVDMIGRTIAEQGVQRTSLGFMSRLATVLLAVMFALKFPQHLDIVSTIIGCFLVPFFILLVGITKRQHKP